MPLTIRRNSDPFKKYWWVLLILFGGIGAWVCAPIWQTDALSKASSSSSGEESLGSSSGTLDSAANPSGAPGGAVDLSMGGSGGYRKRSGEEARSYLYQSAGSAASGAPATAAEAKIKAEGADGASASASLSGAVKKAGGKDDPSGWGGKIPQKGFSAPKANFGGLSGLGGSGGGTSASGGGGYARGNAGVGVVSGGSSSGGGSDSNLGFGTNKALNSLRSARSVALRAAGAGTGDAAASVGARSFDGTSAVSNTTGGKANTGFHAKLDTNLAPANLKIDPIKKPETPEAKKAKKDIDKDKKGDEKEEEDFGMKLLAMVIQVMVGGLAGGMASAISGVPKQ